MPTEGILDEGLPREGIPVAGLPPETQANDIMTAQARPQDVRPRESFDPWLS